MHEDLTEVLDRGIAEHTCPDNNMLCGRNCIRYTTGKCKEARYAVPATCDNAYAWNRFWNDGAAWCTIVIVRQVMERIYRSKHPREFLVNNFGMAVRRQ